MKLPVYTEQVAPSGLGPAATAPTAHVVDTGPALRALGAGLERVAGGLDAHDNYLTSINRQSQLSQFNAQYANGEAFWTKYLQDAETAPDGVNGLTNKLRGDFQQWQAKQLENVSDPVVRAHANDRLTSMQVSFTKQAQLTEFRAAVGSIADNEQRANEGAAVTVGRDPSQYDSVLADRKAAIQNSAIPPQTRIALMEHLDKSLRAAAIQGFVVQNPQGAKATLERALGMPTDRPVMPSETPGGTVQPVRPGDFNTAVQFVLHSEGGYVGNDAGKGPTNFGINQTANPDVNVSELTRDKAVSIYRERYWNAIGGDSLPASTALVAFDTAVNQGVGTAKKLLSETGGDPEKMIEARRAMYEKLARENPQRFTPAVLKGWQARLDGLQAAAERPSDPIRVADSGQVQSDVATFALGTQDNQAPQSTGVSFLDKAPVHDLWQAHQLADGIVHKDMAQAQAALNVVMHDAAAMAADGKPYPNAEQLGPADFIRAYGPGIGAMHYRDFQDTAQLANDVAATRTMTEAQLTDALAKAAPAQGAGYDQARRRYAVLQTAVANTMALRQKDPMVAAVRAGLGAVQVIDWSKPDQAAAELANRTTIARTMTAYGSSNLSAFSSDEAGASRALFEHATPMQRLQMLDTLRRGIKDPDVYMATVQAIRPDSPSTQVAAEIYATGDSVATEPGLLNRLAGVAAAATPSAMGGAQQAFARGAQPDPGASSRNVAETIMRGEDILNPTSASKKEDGKGSPLPIPDKELRTNLMAQYGDAFGTDPKRFEASYQAVRAYYAATALETGHIDGLYDDKLGSTAMRNVLGTVIDRGGHKAVAPWGWDSQRTTAAVETAIGKAIEANGYAGTAFDTPSAYGLRNTSGTRYALVNGDKYLIGSDGHPVVIDLAQPQATGPAGIPDTTAPPAAAPAAPLPAPTREPIKPGRKH
jgi:hypothetical protein